MPSRLIQGHDSFDTCSQFSDSATLHTLTRVGARQKQVYYSRSESNFNNLNTISYGNSSTGCCDPDIKVSRNSDNGERLMRTMAVNEIGFRLLVRRWTYKWGAPFITAIRLAISRGNTNRNRHRSITRRTCSSASSASAKGNARTI